MLGTLNAALEVRDVPMQPEDIQLSIEGDNDVGEDGIPVLTRVRLHYELRIPSGKRDVVERALAKHQAKCPTAAWMQKAVEISWDADIREV